MDFFLIYRFFCDYQVIEEHVHKMREYEHEISTLATKLQAQKKTMDSLVADKVIFV